MQEQGKRKSKARQQYHEQIIVRPHSKQDDAAILPGDGTFTAVSVFTKCKYVQVLVRLRGTGERDSLRANNIQISWISLLAIFTLLSHPDLFLASLSKPTALHLLSQAADELRNQIDRKRMTQHQCRD